MNQDSYIKMLSAYRESFLIMALVEILREGDSVKASLNALELAKATGADSGLLIGIFDSCVSLGFLQKEGDIYSLTQSAESFFCEVSLTRHSPRYHMSYIPLWGGLPTFAVGKAGTPELPSTQVNKDPEAFKNFIRGVVDAHSNTLDVFVELSALNGVRSLLDVGAGAGSYSLALLERHIAMTATLLDFPEVLDIAKEYVQEKSLGKRVTMLPGDLRSTEFGGPYDCILFSNVLHLQSRAEVKLALIRAAAALGPGGMVLINEPVLKSNRTSPKTLAVFNITVILRSGLVGRLFTGRELKELAFAAGFQLLREQRISSEHDLYGRPYTLFIFRRIADKLPRRSAELV